MDAVFINTENSKTNESHRFRLYFTNKLDLRRNNNIFRNFVHMLYVGKYKI